MPLNITFKTALSCYEKPFVNILIDKLMRYRGDIVEIRLCELNMEADFLKKFCILQGLLKSRLEDRIKVKFEIQTAGVGMTIEMAKFIKKESITICLLMDGPKDIHECNNLLLKRTALHEHAVRAASLLTQCKVDLYIGITVTSVVARNIQSVFSFFIENGWNAQAYWPVTCASKPEMAAMLLSELDYQYFLEKLFSYWKYHRMNGQSVYVREFENFAGSIKGYVPLVSSISGRCPFQNVFLPDGSIYLRGCLTEQNKYLCKQLEEQDLIVTKDIDAIQKECKVCRWVSLCQGDRTCCMNSSVFCETYKKFYISAMPGMFDVLRKFGR